ncbi:MAG TPA: agmatine deiminase family protein [Acidobacteriota bacterium]|nr:agmatine deiminase family protein [Acidobacteriota bacterium]
MNGRPTPSGLGFFMPAEWHPHQATWLAWPTNSVTWPGLLDGVQDSYLEIISLLARFETVRLLVDDERTARKIRSRLSKRGVSDDAVAFVQVPTVDAWIRDYGPNFLIRRADHAGEESSERPNKGRAKFRKFGSQEGADELSEKTLVAYNHWRFNAWGNKYEELKRDERVPALLQPHLRMPRFEPGIVLEGGSIEVNGAGVCLTTEQCLLNRNRNPALSQDDIDCCLKNFLGVEKVLWLGEGIAGDDTDGHVDDIARFVDERTVVCAVEEDPADVNHDPLQENLQRLRLMTDARSKPFRIVPLPMPEAVMEAGERLPASYANFYIANRQVLVPIFGCGTDRRALRILSDLFPEREVLGIRCETLVLGMGALHCLTQQQPSTREA